MTTNSLGQYFTTNFKLKETIYKFILNKPTIILEPSVGRGDLVEYVQSISKDIEFDMYEIDETINFLETINKDDIHFGDFMKQIFTKKYETIIGNPPYIKHKKGNLYIDFTQKCFELLEDNGELIFIVPSDFFKLTSAVKLLHAMMQDGTFTHIYHPHNEKLFEDASIDVIVFRYCKNKLLEKVIMYNDELLYISETNGLITFSKNINKGFLLKDMFDIYVGLVSGKEEVYKNVKFGNIEVLNGKDKIDKYIFYENYPTGNDIVDKYLLENKDKLLSRKIRKFNENNWFEWGAPRNMTSIKKNIGKDCIYIYNLTRKTQVAFLDKVRYFGGNLIMLIPKEATINLAAVVGYMNSNEFKKNFMFSGRFKIGHRNLENSCFNTTHII